MPRINDLLDRYLRRVGTNVVCKYTPALYNRPEFELIDKDEANRRIAAQKIDAQERYNKEFKKQEREAKIQNIHYKAGGRMITAEELENELAADEPLDVISTIDYSDGPELKLNQKSPSEKPLNQMNSSDIEKELSELFDYTPPDDMPYAEKKAILGKFRRGERVV